MWLPRPITQRSPIRSTVCGPRSWAGTMPAESETCAPISVSSPISIQPSPKIDPAGNAISEPRPNRAKALPAGVSAVTMPACWNSRQPQCTACHTACRRAVPTCRLRPFHHVTPALSRNYHSLGRSPRPRADRSLAPVVMGMVGAGLGEGEEVGAGAAGGADGAAGDGRGELAAGAVDLASPGVPDRDRDPMIGDPADELLLDAGPRRRPLRAGGGVERDQVDVHQVPRQQLAEAAGPPSLVVDVPVHAAMHR